MTYPGIDGFLGTRASLAIDAVSLAMVVVLPALAANIYLARYRKAYVLHKRWQLVLTAVLLVAVSIFEIDMRVNGWRERAAPSPYYHGDGSGLAEQALGVHLFFAVSTAVLWVVVVAQALVKFPRPAAPGLHSRSQRRWGWIAAVDLACTAVTGWVFYWLAFAAT